MFEYICGGGFFNQELPATLANEGRKMLQALLDELKLNKHIQIVLLLDRRFANLELPINCEVVWADDVNFLLSFDIQLDRCEAVLPIAPEQDDLLTQIAVRVKERHKQLWLSAPNTVRLCTHKLQTLEHLAQAGLAVVETQWLNDCQNLSSSSWVIKPNDGMGCQGSMIIHGQQGGALTQTENLIIQPFIEGDSLSLSAVFFAGKGHLLTCNRQHIRQTQQRFSLHGCTINIQHNLRQEFTHMIDRIAAVLPDLWGYIGIDLILSPEQGPLILEINPRLTTSYAGLYPATGISIHLQLLNALNGRAYDFTPIWNKSIDVYV